jgi:hypothetical protein
MIRLRVIYLPRHVNRCQQGRGVRGEELRGREGEEERKREKKIGSRE